MQMIFMMYIFQRTVVNACERYVLEIPDRPVPPKHLGKLIWKNGAPKVSEPVEEEF